MTIEKKSASNTRRSSNIRTHVFEGMREVMQHGALSWKHLGWAFGLNLVWLGLGALFFRWILMNARERGLRAKLGTQ